MPWCIQQFSNMGAKSQNGDFVAIVCGRIRCERSRAYQTTTISMRMEIETVIMAMRWLSSTYVVTALIISDS